MPEGHPLHAERDLSGKNQVRAKDRQIKTHVEIMYVYTRADIFLLYTYHLMTFTFKEA